jgi:hypothetical protein
MVKSGLAIKMLAARAVLGEPFGPGMVNNDFFVAAVLNALLYFACRRAKIFTV